MREREGRAGQDPFHPLEEQVRGDKVPALGLRPDEVLLPVGVQALVPVVALPGLKGVGEGGVENDLAGEDGGGEGGGPLPWEQATAEGPSPTEGRDVP